METFLEVSLVNLIRLYAIDFSSWYESLSTIFSCVALSFSGLFIILAPIFLWIKKKDLTDPLFVSKFGSLV